MASKAIKLVAGVMTPDSDLPTEVQGLVQSAAGTIVVYDGGDATGPAVLASSVIGTFSTNEPIVVRKGLFVVLTGGALGSLLTS